MARPRASLRPRLTSRFERQFTEALAAFLPAGRQTVVGIGDDAAVVRNASRHSVLCCDPVVEGVHFLATAPMHLVGNKAVQRNLADLAAMGALADFLLVSVVLPPHFPASRLEQLFVGLRRAASGADCTIVGGDLAVGPGPLVVTVTAVGHLVGKPLLRRNARVGDTLHVSGPLGGSLAGHHLRFRAPLAEGAWLARQRGIGGALDVSDGLLLDLQTMLTASGCPGAELDAAAIPVRAAARQLAGGDRQVALRRAFADGEDHVLLWSQRPAALAPGGPLTARARRPIGRIVATPGLWLVQPDGQRQPLEVAGYEHRFDATAPARKGPQPRRRR